MGVTYTIVGNLKFAGRFLARALSLDPNSAWACNRSGLLHAYLGHLDVSIEHFERALRLSPFDPMNFNVYVGLGAAHFVAGRIEEAALWQERGLIEKPNATWVYRNLVAIYALLGRDAEAKAGLAKLLAEYPDLTISKIAAAIPFPRSTQERWAEGLRKVGLPE